jgi:hypothetical protein
MVVRINEAQVSMSMVDGDVLTPRQLQSIVAAVKAELARDQQDALNRRRLTRVGGGVCESCDETGEGA